MIYLDIVLDRKYDIKCPHLFDFSDSMYRWPLMRLYLPREYFRHPLPYRCDWDQPTQCQILLAHIYCFSSFSKVLARKKNLCVWKFKKTAVHELFCSRFTKKLYISQALSWNIFIKILDTLWLMVLSIVWLSLDHCLVNLMNTFYM